MILAVGTGFKTTRREETEYFVSRSVSVSRSPSVSLNGEFPVHYIHCLLFLVVSHLLASLIDLMSVKCVWPVPPLCLVVSCPPHLYKMFSPASLWQFGHVFVCFWGIWVESACDDEQFWPSEQPCWLVWILVQTLSVVALGSKLLRIMFNRWSKITPESTSRIRSGPTSLVL